MTDGLSIAASVVTLVDLCVRVSKSIYIFSVETKDVDKSVAAVYGEIVGLKEVLSGISGCFRNRMIATTLESGIGKQHLQHVKVSLKDCYDTLERLDQVVRHVNSVNGRFL